MWTTWTRIDSYNISTLLPTKQAVKPRLTPNTLTSVVSI